MTLAVVNERTRATAIDRSRVVVHIRAESDPRPRTVRGVAHKQQQSNKQRASERASDNREFTRAGLLALSAPLPDFTTSSNTGVVYSSSRITCFALEVRA